MYRLGLIQGSATVALESVTPPVASEAGGVCMKESRPLWAEQLAKIGTGQGVLFRIMGRVHKDPRARVNIVQMEKRSGGWKSEDRSLVLHSSQNRQSGRK